MSEYYSLLDAQRWLLIEALGARMETPEGRASLLRQLNELLVGGDAQSVASAAPSDDGHGQGAATPDPAPASNVIDLHKWSWNVAGSDR